MSKVILIIIVIIVVAVFFFYWGEISIKQEYEELTEPKDISEPNDIYVPNNRQEPNNIYEPNNTQEPNEAIDQEKEVSNEQEPEDKLEPFQAGMNILVYGHPNMLVAISLFQRLRELGVNSIAIVFPLFQEDWQASLVQTNTKITPTIEEIKGLILIAQEEGLSVMLRPTLDEESIMASGHWRGLIQPTNAPAWFDSYRALLLSYAHLAQMTNIEYFNIGTEFNSLQQVYGAEWIRIIEEIREVYQGKIIYSFNWDRLEDIADSQFVPLLDYIGIDAYFPLDAPDDASVFILEEAWQHWLKDLDELLSVKPILITEAGIIPVNGAYRTPYSWDIANRRLDPEAQANYYMATYRSWRPMIAGLYWWSVTITEPNPLVIDYSPLRSPTESVLKELFHDQE